MRSLLRRTLLLEKNPSSRRIWHARTFAAGADQGRHGSPVDYTTFEVNGPQDVNDDSSVDERNDRL